MGLYDHSDSKVYVVTLENKSDLESFYSDMESDGYQLHLKRPISRSTEYYMNSTQAEDIRNDSRVAAVEINEDDDPIREIIPFYDEVNNTPYGFAGDFEKSSFANNHDNNERQWGHLHSSGSTAERRKGSWGHDNLKNVTDNVEIFADGKHVDVVIVDQPVSYDCDEWKSPTTGQSRFVQYDWFGELNGYVSSIDDDGMSLPSGTYPYHPNSVNTTFHGTHVAGTVAGQWYGWAREANIYSLHVNLGSGFGTSLSSRLVFDYLRAFHRHKPINPLTGKKNPTVTNHSWGSSYNIYSFFERSLTVNDIQEIIVRGVTYTSGNPGPSGWTMDGIHKDFGVGSTQFRYNMDSTASRYDMEDAIEDGVVCIAAAGNNDQYSIHADPTAPEYTDWNNSVTFFLPSPYSGTYTVYHNRGFSPANAKGCITVGSISNLSNFSKSDFSNFGPLIDVWAPGHMIHSAWPDPSNIYSASGLNGAGYPDSKYGGDNWRYPISGTSMASPQVCGIAALLATGKERFTNSDVLGFIQNNSYENDITFNVNGGLFDDRTCDGGANTLYGGSTSTSKEIKAINPRNISGLIDGWYKETLKGHRRPSHSFSNAQMYPRTNNYYRPRSESAYNTYSITVTAASGNYVFTGSDMTNTYSNSTQPRIDVKQGDTIQFTINASDHPFWIKTSQSTGTSNVYNTGVTGNGTSAGSEVVFNTGDGSGSNYANAPVYDPINQKVVIAYQDLDNNSAGTAVVGTVSGTSISFSSEVEFSTDMVATVSSAYDSNSGKVVIAYNAHHASDPSRGKAVVGTVSGNTISFGTPVEFNSSGSSPFTSTVYDPINQKIVIAYTDGGNSNYGTAIVGTVSGNSISFGTPVVYNNSLSTQSKCTYDSTNQKVVIAYRDDGNSNIGGAVVGTVSGTSITFGSPVVFNSGTIGYGPLGNVYDPINQKVVIAFEDRTQNPSSSGVGGAVVGTVSGTSITFGSTVIFNNIGGDSISSTYDSDSGKVVIAYRDFTDALYYGTAIVGTVSGNSISFGSNLVFSNSQSDHSGSTYDSTNGKVVIAYQSYDGTDYTGKSVVLTNNITGNGTDNGSITWNTAGVPLGAYYYNCEYHSSMNGIIFINA